MIKVNRSSQEICVPSQYGANPLNVRCQPERSDKPKPWMTAQLCQDVSCNVHKISCSCYSLKTQACVVLRIITLISLHLMGFVESIADVYKRGGFHGENSGNERFAMLDKTGVLKWYDDDDNEDGERQVRQTVDIKQAQWYVVTKS